MSLAELKRSPRAWIKSFRGRTYLRTDRAMANVPVIEDRTLPRQGWEPLYDQAALDAAVAAAREHAADNTTPETDATS